SRPPCRGGGSRIAPADSLVRSLAANFGAFANSADEGIDDLDLAGFRVWPEVQGVGEGVVGRKKRVAGIEQVGRKPRRSRKRRGDGERACLGLAICREG